MANLIDKLLSLLGSDSLSVSEVGNPPSEVEEGTTFDCELSRIYVDYDWNGRRGNWQADLDDIERSMLPDGDSGPIRQDLPGVVRPRVPSKEQTQDFALVSGFGRYTVLERIAKRLELEHPTMSVILRKLDEPDALEQNIRENVGRNQQRMVDTAFQLHKAWKTRGMENAIWLQPNDIAPRVAMNPGLVKTLLHIMRNGDQEMLEAWRKSQLNISYVDIEKIVSKYPRMQHLAQFKLLLLGIDERKVLLQAANLSDKDRRYKTIQRARSLGSLLRELERLNCITVNEQYLQSAADDLTIPLVAHLGRNFDVMRLVQEILNGYRSSVIGSRSEKRNQKPDYGEENDD